MRNIIISPITSQASWNAVVCIARSLGYDMVSEKGTRYEKLFRSSRTAIRLGDDGTYGNGKSRWYEADKYDDYELYSADEFVEEFGDNGCSPDSDIPASYAGTSAPKSTSILTKVNSFARRLLSPEIRTLLRAGYLTNDLRLTPAGQEALFTLLLSEKQAELVAFARANRTEDSEDETDGE